MGIPAEFVLRIKAWIADKPCHSGQEQHQQEPIPPLPNAFDRDAGKEEAQQDGGADRQRRLPRSRPLLPYQLIGLDDPLDSDQQHEETIEHTPNRIVYSITIHTADRQHEDNSICNINRLCDFGSSFIYFRLDSPPLLICFDYTEIFRFYQLFLSNLYNSILRFSLAVPAGLPVCGIAARRLIREACTIYIKDARAEKRRGLF